jgi:hypothetical protein
MVVKKLVIIGLLLIVATSCYYDNGDVLYPYAEANCDTKNVSFSAVASPIIYQSCATTNCHVAGTGRVPLTNYQEIKSSVDNGLFAQRVFQAKDMPPQGPLSSCNIKKLNAWLNNGANND